MTTIHVRYEILDDPHRPHPDSTPDAAPWGVRAVGLPEQLGAYGVVTPWRRPWTISAMASARYSATVPSPTS
jgi:hypothetical protein